MIHSLHHVQNRRKTGFGPFQQRDPFLTGATKTDNRNSGILSDRPHNGFAETVG